MHRNLPSKFCCGVFPAVPWICVCVVLIALYVGLLPIALEPGCRHENMLCCYMLPVDGPWTGVRLALLFIPVCVFCFLFVSVFPCLVLPEEELTLLFLLHRENTDFSILMKDIVICSTIAFTVGIGCFSCCWTSRWICCRQVQPMEMDGFGVKEMTKTWWWSWRRGLW
jgi:hypothetical protein